MNLAGGKKPHHGNEAIKSICAKMHFENGVRGLNL
jgi:hypothetical protein